MRVGTNQFKGRIPKLSNRALPDTNASIAVNTRLRSGDIQPYNGLTQLVTLVKSGKMSSIYPLDIEKLQGGPYWLSWTPAQTVTTIGEVDVARSAVLDDYTNRIMYTGAADVSGSLYRPKWTNLPLATIESLGSNDTSGLPYNWRLLGVPAPGTFNNTYSTSQPLTVSQSVNFSMLPYALISDGSSLSNWVTSTLLNSSVTVDNTTGNPTPCFLFACGSASGTTNPTLLYGNTNLSMMQNGLLGSIKGDVLALTTAASSYLNYWFHFGCGSTGNGYALIVNPANGVSLGTVSLFRTSAWRQTPNPFSDQPLFLVNNVEIQWGKWYTIEVDYIPSNITSNIYNCSFKITDSLTGAQTFSYTANNIMPPGGYFGLAYESTASYPNQDKVRLDNVYQTNLLSNSAYEATSYTYTYSNDYGEEGPPATPTATYFIGPGITTTLSGFDSTGYSQYVLPTINLYRAVTGATGTQFEFMTNFTNYSFSTTQTCSFLSGATSITVPTPTGIQLGQQVVGSGIAQYTFVSSIIGPVVGLSYPTYSAETSVPVTFQAYALVPNVTSYTDTLLDNQLGEVLQTDNYDLPPNDGHHITTLANGITIMASSNAVCPSVQYRQYAYPEAYRLATDAPIMDIVGVETMAVIITSGSCYLCIGSDPSAMTLTKMTAEYGAVGYNSGIRLGNYGAAYLCNQGIVMVTAYGAQLISDQFITKREFASYYPASVIGAVYEDMYFGFYNTGTLQQAFIFDVKDNGVGFIDLQIAADAIYADHYNELICLTQASSNVVYSFDTGTPLNYQWRSKTWQLPYPAAMQMGQVRAIYPEGFIAPNAPLTFNMYKDQLNSPFFTFLPTSDMEFTVSAQVMYTLQLEALGSAQISMLQAAEDVMELQ